jgi:hypothetical protein
LIEVFTRAALEHLNIQIAVLSRVIDLTSLQLLALPISPRLTLFFQRTSVPLLRLNFAVSNGRVELSFFIDFSSLRRQQRESIVMDAERGSERRGEGGKWRDRNDKILAI